MATAAGTKEAVEEDGTATDPANEAGTGVLSLSELIVAVLQYFLFLPLAKGGLSSSSSEEELLPCILFLFLL